MLYYQPQKDTTLKKLGFDRTYNRRKEAFDKAVAANRKDNHSARVKAGIAKAKAKRSGTAQLSSKLEPIEFGSLSLKRLRRIEKAMDRKMGVEPYKQITAENIGKVQATAKSKLDRGIIPKLQYAEAKHIKNKQRSRRQGTLYWHGKDKTWKGHPQSATSKYDSRQGKMRIKRHKLGRGKKRRGSTELVRTTTGPVGVKKGSKVEEFLGKTNPKKFHGGKGARSRTREYKHFEPVELIPGLMGVLVPKGQTVVGKYGGESGRSMISRTSATRRQRVNIQRVQKGSNYKEHIKKLK